MSASDFFSKEEKQSIKLAITEAEKNTSGEIRVHIDSKCDVDVLERAANVFAFLKMHKTKLRNGVLIYLAINDHKFAIIGDVGINKVIPNDFWNNAKDIMQKHFQQTQFKEGLIESIKLTGEKLKEYFPYKSDDINELPDDISYGS